jgi:hypothetical protein
MVEICRDKIADLGTTKGEILHGDISANHTIKALEKYKGQIDYISLFNILHCEEPVNLLKNVFNILDHNGRVGIIHWKYEKTPRGPAMEIRPKPETIINWAKETGFILERQVELPPYHFGLVFYKK